MNPTTAIMDIDLLSKMVYDLILDNDRVALPGVGCFVAEFVPASFSDRGYTINPPYRKLYFRSHPDDGELLVRLYAKSNGVSEGDARRILTDFLAEMKELLFAQKHIVFPGLGHLRAPKENNLFFVADEALDIYPEGFGLEPLSLKTHKETEKELSATMAELGGILGSEEAAEAETESVAGSASGAGSEPIAESVAESTAESVAESTAEPVAGSTAEPAAESTTEPAAESTAEPVAEPIAESVAGSTAEPAAKQETGPARKTMSPGKIVIITIASLLGLAAVLFIVFVLLVNCFPDFLDSLLYTQEELDIINYKL